MSRGIVLFLTLVATAWSSDFHGWRVPVQIEAPEPGHYRLALDGQELAAWLSEGDPFGFRPQDVPFDSLRLVDRESGEVLAAGAVRKLGPQLVANPAFEAGFDGWQAGGDGFRIDQQDGRSVLLIEGADRTPLLQRFRATPHTWFAYRQRVRGSVAAAPHIQRQGEAWQPVERTWFDPYLPAGEWYTQEYLFYIDDKSTWAVDELRVQIERFSGAIESVALHPCEIAIVWEAKQAGARQVWLELAPHDGHQPLPPTRVVDSLPGIALPVERLGDPEWRHHHLRYRLPEVSEAIDLWVAPISQKIVPREPLPARRDSQARLRLARGEGETLQLVVAARQAARLESVRVAGLQGLEVEVRHARYVPIHQPSQPDYNRPGRSTFTGRLPDPLPRFTGADLTPEEPSLIWLDLKASRHVPAGPQEGHIYLSLNGQEVELDLVVEILDFTLPETAGMRMALQFSQYANLFLYPYHKVETREDKHRLSRAYVEALANYRLTAKNPAAGSVWLEREDARLHELRWAVEEQHQTAFVIGHVSGNPLADTTPEAAREAAAAYDEMAAALRHYGWLDRAIIQIDEPQPHAYAGVRRWIEGFRQRPVTADLTFLTFVYHAQSYAGLNDLADILTPLDNDAFSVVSPIGIARRPPGSETWFYYTRTARQWIDAPGISQRFWAPSVHAWGGDGLAVWGINQWWALREDSPHAFFNPWENPHSTWGNGSLAYFYPPSPLGKELPELDLTVVPSLRLLLTRDGVEDVDYHLLLRQLRERAVAAGLPVMAADAVLADFRRPFTQPNRWALCESWWYDYRQRMARAILDLQAQLAKLEE